VCGVNPVKTTIRYGTLSTSTRYFCGAVYEIDKKGIRVVVGCESATDIIEKLRDA
jgi:cystathionine beta-lyase/cystathionine gamma-synthase